ncbi:G-type lectin S-receptor-like serine/threonine-protein kinase At2g19130 [Lycium ferocissimum]|uniref:G-type lectin S-receptor-like serine/threonine-protein kinase At2g19130 n=1 Tax=Lycium ferocissimum TaxID=112874 RepID=UPI00281579FC|nr:G-type lectin S-receptor-like serine/threonine-protein kinase At2g19130 [Lycium ferocissimum]
MDVINKSFFMLCFLFKLKLLHGANTIIANQSLSGEQTLVSLNGIFELGFFKPGQSTKYYIGIWYKKISPQTVVWVANRGTPISDKNSAELKIIEGKLALFNGSKTSIWSTNIASSTTSQSSVVAVLLDNGNLILLRDGSTIWQSFDHPTDTWLPGGKLLFDRNKQKTALISWKNVEDPTPGLYSGQHTPNGTQSLLVWNGTKQYWASVSWNFPVLGLSPQLRANSIFNYTYINNENESYFTYLPRDPSIVTRYLVDVSGQVKLVTWSDTSKMWTPLWTQPLEQCEVYAYCGPFGYCNQDSPGYCNCLSGFEPKSSSEWDIKDFSSGCVRKADIHECANVVNDEKKDRFWVYNNMRLPQDTQSFESASVSDCETTCLNNCSCVAYSYSSNECSIWRRKLLDMRQLSGDDVRGRTIHIRLALSEFKTSKSKKKIIIGVTVSISVFLGLVLMALIWKQQSNRYGFSKVVEGSLVAFSFKDLQYATKNFSEKLGGGGFGSVYKGTLPDLSIVAVKKLEGIGQGEKQFRAEVSTLGTIHHVNLIRLRGFCSEGNKKLLVYKYVENGSLDSLLFKENESNLLDWKTRYQIALGTARGLSYLHHECKDSIIHADIKPENILLDANFQPRLADFGLAKLVGRNFSRVVTSMRGTIGYLAPEWISGVAITTKADVYSFGMMLFELISGRQNWLNTPDENVKFFPSWAAHLLVYAGDMLCLLDNKLDRASADADEVSKICKVALWCIQDDENNRPAMSEVVQILEGVVDVNLPPIPHSFQVFDVEGSSSNA